MTGILYVIGLPIGNLGDVSDRARDVLRSVDTIFCEDTRVSKKLLAHYDIHTPCTAYHSYSGFGKTAKAVRLMQGGRDIALISDAGTPTIADPGVKLVRYVRDTIPDAAIVSIPGPSAVTAALSVSGAPASSFVFLGFLPRKKGREKAFQSIANEDRTVVFYEAPHRLVRALESLTVHIPEDREVIVVREMTKVYEQSIAGTAKEVFAHYQNHPDEVRGEVVVIVSQLSRRSG
ncbi:MAG: 16S rRNA (cytidine(1402)-2'-O)-methyltransferase [Candidatus Kaiserbacteria bacterium]|nr:16S rRNA (cytidine(1402)-2'-O)-methyltransferase [Candidatus Kaiserbacteria bacterium]